MTIAKLKPATPEQTAAKIVVLKYPVLIHVAECDHVDPLLDNRGDERSTAVAATDDRDVQFAMARTLDARRQNLKQGHRTETRGGSLEERAAVKRNRVSHVVAG